MSFAISPNPAVKWDCAKARSPLLLRLGVITVTGTYEGDLIRPLGLVTLYAAYAEGEIDEPLGALPSETPFDGQKRQWPVGRKLSYALKLVRKLRSDQLVGLTSALKEAQTLFSRRNVLVHSQVFSGGRVVSNRPDAPILKVSAEDLTQLAEQILACKEHIWMHRCRHLLPILASQGEQHDA